MDLFGLPTYPEFRDINLKDRLFSNEVSSSRKVVVSELTFSSLYSWRNNEERSQISQLNNNLIIKSFDLVIREPNIWVIGKENLNQTISLILNDYKKVSVLEESLEFITSNEYVIEEDLGNNEYVYEVHKLISKEGKYYRQFKSDLKNFLKNFNNPKIRIYSNKNKKKKRELYDIVYTVFDEWEGYKSISKDISQIEKNALARTLKHGNLYDIVLLVVYQGEKILGFAVLEIINDTIIVSFAKSSVNADGITSTMIKLVAEYADNHNYKYLNLEQDLNIANLRKFKLKFNPQFYIRKFMISNRVTKE